MGIDVNKINLPVNLEFSDVTDSRFKKAKIWVAHTGENLNNSYFEKEVLEEMATTLAGIPIVGYIEATNDDGDEDFSDHRSEIVIKSNGVKIRYAGHAYGFVPPNCTYSFEIRDGKEWLTTEGYVWTKFTDAMQIMLDTNGVKSQSMEVDQVKGQTDDIGRLEVQSARFSALCILGDNVPPAMTGSTIEFFSNKKDQYQFELDEMFKAFQLEKGDSIVVDKDETVVEEPKGDFTADEPEVKEDGENKDFTEDNTTEPEVTEPAQGEPEPTEPEATFSENEDTDEGAGDEQTFSVNEEDKFIALNFELSHDDIRRGIYSVLNDSLGEREYGYVTNVFDGHFIFEKTSYTDEGYTERFFNVTYTKENGTVILGKEEEVFSMFLNADEKAKVKGYREKIASLEAQLEGLSAFKADVESVKKEEMIAEFAEQLGEEVAEEIRGKFAEFSVEEVEKEVALRCFQLMRSQKEETQTAVQVQNFSRREAKYGTLDRFF